MGGNNEFFENFERNKYLKKLPSMQRVKGTFITGQECQELLENVLKHPHFNGEGILHIASKVILQSIYSKCFIYSNSVNILLFTSSNVYFIFMLCLFVFPLNVFCMVLHLLTENGYMAQHRCLLISLIFMSGLPSLSTSRQVHLFIETDTDTRDSGVLPELISNRPLGFLRAQCIAPIHTKPLEHCLDEPMLGVKLSGQHRKVSQILSKVPPGFKPRTPGLVIQRVTTVLPLNLFI